MPNSKYKILKVLNNNVILAFSQSDKQEAILVGKGIGFGHKINDLVTFDAKEVEKTFVTYDEKIKREYYKLINQFNSSAMGISEEIIFLAEKALGELNPHIHIALTDHICFAIERIKAGLEINNPFLHEIQILYKVEYNVAKQAIQKIEEDFGIEMPEDETGFISLHFHSARQNKKVSETVKYTLLIRRLVEIVENELDMKFDISDFSYYRLITHLRFAIERIQKDKSIENPLLETIKNDYQKTFKVAKILGQEIENSIGKKICEGELGYIALHLQRLVFLGIDD